MPEATRPAFADNAKQLWSDVHEMVRTRTELAKVEVQADVHSTKRLAIVGGVGIACLFTSLPLLTFVCAVWVEQSVGIQRHHVMLDVAMILVVAGTVAVWNAWRRFRRDFLGLRDSLAEIREDLSWLRERAGIIGTTDDSGNNS